MIPPARAGVEVGSSSSEGEEVRFMSLKIYPVVLELVSATCARDTGAPNAPNPLNNSSRCDEGSLVHLNDRRRSA